MPLRRSSALHLRREIACEAATIGPPLVLSAAPLSAVSKPARVRVVIGASAAATAAPSVLLRRSAGALPGP